MRLLFKKRAPKPGDTYDGPVTYCTDPLLVRYPGFYATKILDEGNEVPDTDYPLVWIDDDLSDPEVNTGHWEHR